MKAAGYAAAVVAANEIGYPVAVTPDPVGYPRFVVKQKTDLMNAYKRALVASSTGMVNITKAEGE